RTCRRRRERSGVEVTRGALRAAIELPGLSRHQVGTNEDTARARSYAGCIAAQIERERETGLHGHDTRGFPSAEDLRCQPIAQISLVTAERQLVNHRVHQPMTRIEVGP